MRYTYTAYMIIYLHSRQINKSSWMNSSLAWYIHTVCIKSIVNLLFYYYPHCIWAKYILWTNNIVYPQQYPSKSLNIILFDDALRHLLRISRCMGMPKGCILLVGVGEEIRVLRRSSGGSGSGLMMIMHVSISGGSGKQSLTKLASYCAGCSTFQITVTKTYNMNSLLDDIRVLYKSCGHKGLTSLPYPTLPYP